MSFEGGTILNKGSALHGSELVVRQKKAAASPDPILAALQTPTFHAWLGIGEEATRFADELHSLSREPDAKTRHHSLFIFAKRLEDADHIPAALEIYRQLNAPAFENQVSEVVRDRAILAMNAIVGVGASGRRLAFLLERGTDQSLSPEMLAGMVGAGVVGKLAYATLFGRFAANPALLGIGKWAAQGAAGLGALAIEAPAFTVMTKGLGQALGQASDWNLETLLHESYGAFIFLGAMRFSHFAIGRSLGAGPLQEKAGEALTRFSQQVLPQLGTYGGILLAHHAQQKLGLRSAPPNGTAWTDAAAELLNFAVAGHISQRLTGQAYSRWSLETELRAENAAQQTPGVLGAFSLGPRLALAGEASWLGPILMQMSGKAKGEPEGRLLAVPVPPVEPVDIREFPAAGAPPPPRLSPAQVASLQPIARQIQSFQQRGLTLSRLASYLHHAGLAREASQLFQESLQTLEALPDTDLAKGMALSQWALLRYEASGPAEAQQGFIKAMRIAEQLKNLVQKNKDPDDAQDLLRLLFTVAGDLEAAGFSPRAEQVHEWARKIFSSFPKDSFPESLGKEQVLDLARRGYFEAAHKLAKRLPDPESYGPAFLELGILAAKRGDLSSALEAVTLLQDALDCDPLHRALALELARQEQWPEAEFHLDSIQNDAAAIESGLFVARRNPKMPNLARLLERAEARLTDLKNLPLLEQARLQAMFANQAAFAGERGKFQNYQRAAENSLTLGIGRGGEPGAEAVKIISEMIFGNQSIAPFEIPGPWLERLAPALRNEAISQVGLHFADAGKANAAEAWIRFLPREQRSRPQKLLAIRFAELGLEAKALNLAHNIPEARQRFDALEEIYLRSQNSDKTPSPSSTGTPSENSPSGGQSQGSGFSLAPTFVESLPAEEAAPRIETPVKTPQPAKTRTPLLWEPDLSVLEGVAWQAWSGFRSGSPQKTTPMELSSFAGSAGKSTPKENNPRNEGVQLAAARLGPGGITFDQEVIRFAAENQRAKTDLTLLENFLKQVRGEMRRVFDTDSKSPTAHALATGQPVLLRMVPLNPSNPRDLAYYRFSLEPLPSAGTRRTFQSAWQNELWWELNPGTGALKPIESQAHAIWQYGKERDGLKVSDYFVTYYRLLKFQSDLFRAQSWVPDLGTAGSIASERPTQQVPPPPQILEFPAPAKTRGQKPPKRGIDREKWEAYYESMDTFLAVEADIAHYAKHYGVPAEAERKLVLFSQDLMRAMAGVIQVQKPDKVIDARFFHFLVEMRPEGPKIVDAYPSFDSPERGADLARLKTESQGRFYRLKKALGMAPPERVILIAQDIGAGSGGIYVEHIDFESEADAAFKSHFASGKAITLHLTSVAIPFNAQQMGVK